MEITLWLALILASLTLIMGLLGHSIQTGYLMVAVDFEASSPVAPWKKAAENLLTLFYMLAMGCAALLFRCFRKGNIFSTKSVNMLTGFTLFSALTYITSVLTRPTLDTDEDMITILITGQDLAILLFLAILITFSFVLAQAKKLSDDITLIF